MPQPSIETIGTEKWLDATAEIHNGHGFARLNELLGPEFDAAHDWRTLWPLHAIAKEFRVAERTMQYWVTHRKKEVTNVHQAPTGN